MCQYAKHLAFLSLFYVVSTSCVLAQSSGLEAIEALTLDSTDYKKGNEYSISSGDVVDSSVSSEMTSPEDELKLLKQELEKSRQATDLLTSRITHLESKIEEKTLKNAPVDALLENLDHYYSFTYRYNTARRSGDRTMDRQRIKVRTGFDYKVNDEFDLGFGLLLGSRRPNSGYVTLGDAFSAKALYADLAYLRYKPSQLPGMSLTGGKMLNPFYFNEETQFIWDDDVRPEGLALHYHKKLKDLELSSTLGAFSVELRPEESDTYLFSGQGVAKYNINKLKSSIITGVSYYDFYNIRHQLPLFDTTNPFGSSVDITGRYTKDYNLSEIFGALRTNLVGIPTSVFGNYSINTGANEENQAWILGTTLGKLTKPNSITAFYDYRFVQKDSMLSMLVDGADPAGIRVGVQGHRFGLEYQLLKHLSVRFFYYIEEYLDKTSKNINNFKIDLRYKL